MKLRAFIVNTKINIDKPDVNQNVRWPSLETNVRREAERNLVSGNADFMVGTFQLYGRLSNRKIIKHTHLSLTLVNTVWGYSLWAHLRKREKKEARLVQHKNRLHQMSVYLNPLNQP